MRGGFSLFSSRKPQQIPIATTGPSPVKMALVAEQAGLLPTATANAAAAAVTDPNITPNQLRDQINTILNNLAGAAQTVVSPEKYKQLQEELQRTRQKLDQLERGLARPTYRGGRRKHTRSRKHKRTRRHR